MEQIRLRLESANDADRIRDKLGSSIRRQTLIEMAAAIVVVAESDCGRTLVAASSEVASGGASEGETIDEGR